MEQYEIEKKKNYDALYSGKAQKALEKLSQKLELADNVVIREEDRQRLQKLTNSKATSELNDLFNSIDSASRLILPKTASEIYGNEFSFDQNVRYLN